MRTNLYGLRGWVWLTAFAGCAIGLPSALAAESDGIFQWRPFLGPFHSVLLHFPIGFVTMAFLVDLYYLLWRRKPEVQQVITLMLGLSVATTLLTIVLGLLRAGGAEYDARTLDSHRNYGIAVGVLTVLTLILQRRGYAEGTDAAPNRLLRGGYRTLLLGNIVMLVIAGHQGGNLTHGSNYLTKNAPEFVKILVEDEPETPDPALVGATEEDNFFIDKVKPVFDTKCLSCHGPEKQRMGFRVDTREAAFKGGKVYGPAIVPGSPPNSSLYHRISMRPDRDIHDELMPPVRRKDPLTAAEIALIAQWITEGAVWPDGATLAANPATPSAKSAPK